MKKIAWLILFLFTAKIISAQCEEKLSQLNSAKSDTAQLQLYSKVLDCYEKQEDFSKALEQCGKYKLSVDKCVKKYNDSLYFRSYLADMATFYFFKGDVQECLNISKKLLSYDHRHLDSNKIATTLGNIAILYRKQGDFPRAIYYLQESIKINQKNQKELSGNYTNLANVYLDISKFDKAKELFTKALQLRIAYKDEKGQAVAYSNMGNYFLQVLKFDSALYYYAIAINLYEKQKTPNGKKISVYNNITRLYIKTHQLDSAIKYSDITEGLINGQTNPSYIAHFYQNKGDITSLLKKYSESIQYYDLGMHLSAQNNDISRLSELYSAKSLSYHHLKNIDSSFYNRNMAEKLKDSIFNSSKTAQITRYEMQYQFDKEQETLKSEQLKKEIETKHALERKQLLIYAALVALILLFGLVLLVLKSNNQKKKDNLLLQQKNDLIESQKKDIIDSINYAKNLQQAILPPLTKIKQELGDGFIYYKPKDIIAGDFYWLYKTTTKNAEEIFLFAVADCTGHGVPGALVSVVCSNALDSSVKEHNLTDPGMILDKTKEIVLQTFSKTGQNVKDGMDISLCSIQRNTLNDKITIKWAGANNSLWYIHHNEIKELTANKQPIGASEHSQPFTTHSIELSKGDTLYFSTDGYYDQFGGDKGSASGKKFMRKRLAQLFFSIKDQAIDAQLKTIDDTFRNWKGALEQIDDVCVAGIKL